jgi:hypothetical protein
MTGSDDDAEHVTGEISAAAPPSNADLIVLLSETRDALMKEVLDLKATVARSKHDTIEPSLDQLNDIRNFPPSASDTEFTVRELRKLPEDPGVPPLTLLDSRKHPLVLANAIKLQDAFQAKDPARAAGQHTAIAHELRPLLTLASVQKMETAIHAKLAEDVQAGEIPYGLVLDTFDSLAYLSTWRAGLLEARVSELASLLQYDNSAARDWAGAMYGTQNTLMGDGPNQLAFVRERAADARREQPAAPKQQGRQQQQQQQQQAPAVQQKAQHKKKPYKPVRGAAATAEATAGARS